jgi:nitrite reductase/ring-hydroxylating ferredoxin subunit
MTVEVAKLHEIPEGGMKRVTVNGERILLANVEGRICATSDRCGHQNASLSKGSLKGRVVTCPLHSATFDVTTGQNLSGPQLMMSPALMEKIPPEVLTMFKRNAEILSEITIEPLKTYKIAIKGTSVLLEEPPKVSEALASIGP